MNRGDRSPIHGRLRCNTALGPWLYAGLWTASTSYILAGRDLADGQRRWTVMQRLPLAGAKIHRIHIDGITSSSGGQEIAQRMWVAVDGGPLYVSPIPRGNDNPLATDPTFTANYCGTARMDLGRDDWNAPGTPKVYRECEVWADMLLSGVRYADVFYQIDGGNREYLGRAQDSPKSRLWFRGTNGDFVTGQDIELSIESYTFSLNVAPVYRSIVLRGVVTPNAVDNITAITRVADNMRDREGSPMREGALQLQELRDFAKGGPVRLTDLTGAQSWVKVQQGVDERELYQQGEQAPEVAATVKMSVLDFTSNTVTTWGQIAAKYTWSQLSAYTWAQVMNLP